MDSEISYEQYSEMIEEISQEEGKRGACYGEEYARNHVFEFAQKALDRAKDQAHALSLADAKKQYEIERQKTEQSLKNVVQQYLADVQTITQQHSEDLKTLTQEQKEDLTQNLEEITRHTKSEIEQVIATQLQDERKKLEQEIREQEDLRPARAAAQTAIQRIMQLEKRARNHLRRRNGLVGLGFAFVLLLAILLISFPPPQWLSIAILIVIAAAFAASQLWKSGIPEDKLAEGKRQIALFQTKGGDYAGLSEEERCALLAQRVS
jgi:hypothetical protein